MFSFNTSVLKIATPGVKIAMVNIDCPEVKTSTMQAVASALTVQAQQHFALPPPFGYGFGATVRVTTLKSVKKDEWVLMLLANPDVDGALGYHDQTDSGMPIIKIFPRLDALYGSSWSVTASHEVLETLADPNIAKAAMSVDGNFWAYEICDAVEQDTYLINKVPVSNFVLPPYFEPVNNYAGVKLDYLGLIKQPLEIRPGGYGQYFDPATGWNAVYDKKVEPTKLSQYRTTLHDKHMGRGARRSTKKTE